MKTEIILEGRSHIRQHLNIGARRKGFLIASDNHGADSRVTVKNLQSVDQLLHQLAARAPDAIELAGIDAAPAMIDVARANAGDPRLTFSVGVAEQLPYADANFDLVVSTTSFDHWRDQQAGLQECARVMTPGAQLVLADQFSTWLLPTLLGKRRDKARTKSRAARLITATGLNVLQWHDLNTVIIRAVTAAK